MEEWWLILVLAGGWVVLQRWILPKLGLQT